MSLKTKIMCRSKHGVTSGPGAFSGLRHILITSFFALCPASLPAAIFVTNTPDALISADTAVSQSYTLLSGPVMDEGLNRDIGNSSPATIVLSAPANYVFQTNAVVSVAVSLLAGSTNELLTLASSNPIVTASTITLTVNSRDVSGSTRARLTWSGIQVRPVLGSPLLDGNITLGGTANLNGGNKITSMGRLRTLPGTANSLKFVRQPAGAVYATPFTTQPIIAACDQFGNNSTNGLPGNLPVQLALTSGLGGVSGYVNPDIGTNVGNGFVTFSGVKINRAETGDILTAKASGFNSVISDPFDVQQLALTVAGITALTRVYDGTTVAALNTNNASLNGVISGDDVRMDLSTAYGVFSNPNEGLRSASVIGITITGVSANNYTVATPVTPLVQITRAPVTVSGIVASNKVYDSLPTALVNISGATLIGVVAGEVVLLQGNPSATFLDAAAGAGKTVAITGLTLGGAAAANYLLNPVLSVADITPLNLPVSAVVAEKVYDGLTAASVTLNYSPITNDNLTVGYTASFYSAKNAGSNLVVNVTGLTLAGSAAANYYIPVTNITALGVINPKPLTVTAADVARTYDGTAFGGGGGVLYQGFVSGETNTDLTGILSYSGNAQGAKYPGQYAIVPGGLSGSNYVINFANGTLTINKASLTVSPGNSSRLYDQPNPEFQPIYSGLVGGDDSSVVSGIPVFSTPATNGSDVGSYPIIADVSALSSTNYLFAASNGVLTILPARFTTRLSSSANPSPGGTVFSIQAIYEPVSPSITYPSGDAVFSVVGTNWLNTAGINAGIATLTNISLPHGSHTFVVAYAGSSNYLELNSASPLVQSVNSLPLVGPDVMSTRQGVAVSAPVFKLLINDSDADGDQLTVQEGSSFSQQGGAVVSQGDIISYTPPTNYHGADAFHYVVTDGYGGVSTGLVSVTVSAAAASRLNLVSIKPGTGGAMVATFAGIPGFAYEVQAKNDLNDLAWFSLSTNTAATNGLFSVVDAAAANFPRRFYRSISR